MRYEGELPPDRRPDIGGDPPSTVPDSVSISAHQHILQYGGGFYSPRQDGKGGYVAIPLGEGRILHLLFVRPTEANAKAINTEDHRMHASTLLLVAAQIVEVKEE
jgi:hypothetical protein